MKTKRELFLNPLLADKLLLLNLKVILEIATLHLVILSQIYEFCKKS